MQTTIEKSIRSRCARHDGVQPVDAVRVLPQFMEAVTVVTFHELADNQTPVMYQMDFQPEGIAETAAAALNLSKRVEGDLGRFKKFIEARGEETGAWRGTIS